MSFIYFGSGCSEPYDCLSNFDRAPIVVHKNELDSSPLQRVNPHLKAFFGNNESLTFPSSEHLWQALKAKTHAAFVHFLDTGTLNSLAPFVFHMLVGKQGEQMISASDKAATKSRYWRSRRDKVGVLAKMIVNRRLPSHVLKRFGLQRNEFDYERELLPSDLEEEVWLYILSLKFRQNERHRNVLLNTRNAARLVEMARSAAVCGAKEHWGGFVRDGVVHGSNVMGRYMVQTRTAFDK